MTGNSLREDVLEYVKKKYKTEPEYLWRSDPDSAVLRHADNRKWYGLVMNISGEKIGILGRGNIDVLNVKIADVLLRDMLIGREGFYAGYHMNKQHWISVLLDGSVAIDTIKGLIDQSFEATAPKRKSKA